MRIFIGLTLLFAACSDDLTDPLNEDARTAPDVYADAAAQRDEISTCFLPGTAIRLPNGESIAIEQLRVGDPVLAYDEAARKVTSSIVLNTFIHEVDEPILVLDGTIQVTSEHPFYKGGKWVEARELKEGDVLLTVTNEERRLEKIERRAYRGKVFNIEVGIHHNYFAENILVHNKSDIWNPDAGGCATPNPTSATDYCTGGTNCCSGVQNSYYCDGTSWVCPLGHFPVSMCQNCPDAGVAD